ncbi:MAG: LacI family DNA-binding transcriptional regulator [Pseudomonadota bacterium]
MRPQRVKTMEEFAALSGISRPTLSKFFNDPKSVRASTRARIEAALARYEYTPNIYAVNQNRLLTRNIGIVVPYLADPFFAEVARNLEPLCAEAGFNPILLSSHGDPGREIENLASLRSIKPAGVLLAPLGRRSRRDEIDAFCSQVPTVLFDCDITGIGDAFFGSNNAQSIRIIVDYLCQTGEPPAFFAMANAPNPNANKRHAAYEAAMRARGQTPMILAAEGEGWNFEEIGLREGGRLIDARALPTDTVLCSNDRLAIGVLAAAYERGQRVGIGPGHALRIAGHDNHPYARYTCPALTTVSQDYDAIAGSSLDRLLAIIESGVRPVVREAQLFDGTLVRRASA